MTIATDSSTASSVQPNRSRLFLQLGILPIVFYFAAFCVLTFPLITSFSTALWGDATDGRQSVWNLWWMDKAVTQLHQSPWTTTYVFAPTGVSLLPHDLNATNAFIGIFLQAVLSIGQAYNLIVIAGFVLTGLTMFWLVYYLIHSMPASLLSGFIVTFSSYHFAHLLSAHLTVISMEWMPLFLLCWLLLLHKPTYLKAAAAALVLSVNAYTSLYMFLYLALIGGAIAVWMVLFQRPRLSMLTRELVLRLAAFVVITLVVCGPLIVPVLLLGRRDPIMANHITSVFSMDPFSLVIPGSGWRFADLTRAHWQYVTTAGNIDEHSIFLGSAALFLLIYTAVRRRQLPEGQRKALLMWSLLTLVFVLLALGPVIRVWGKQITFPLMPYTILERLLPPLRSSGVPVRINVLTVMCVAVLCGCGAAYLLHEREGQRPLRRYVIFATLVALMALDYIPRPVPTFDMTVPAYVNALKALPTKGVILDTVSSDSEKMLDQIVHEKPMAFGYIARITTSVQKDRVRLLKLIADHDYVAMCRDFQIGTLVTAAAAPAPQAEAAGQGEPALTVSQVYHDADVTIYALDCGGQS